MSAQMHHTPLDLARQHGHGTVVEVLESIEMKEVHLSDEGVSVLAHVTCDVILVFCSCTCTVCGLNMYMYIIHILY